MTGVKALLVFTLLTGVFAEECDLEALDLEAFAETVTVTNVSKGWTASVLVDFDHSMTGWRLEGGTSRTASGLLAATWQVRVIAPRSSQWLSYEGRLEQARDDLVGITLDPDATPDQVADAATGLVFVVGALEQVAGQSFVQSCSGTFEPGVGVNVTIDSTDVGGVRQWVLDCG